MQIFTCACAVEFRSFLEKYLKYQIGLSGFERKLLIAYPITLVVLISFSMRSQNRAYADNTFSENELFPAN